MEGEGQTEVFEIAKNGTEVSYLGASRSHQIESLFIRRQPQRRSNFAANSWFHQHPHHFLLLMKRST